MPPPLNSLLRRNVLVCLATMLVSPLLPAEEVSVSVVKIQVDPGTVVSRIPPDFIGFGYETSAVAETNYFSADNTTLVRIYRNLTPHGLIRIGGIISDHAKYVPDGTPVVQTMSGTTVFNQANLQALGGFARATGWHVMWGLNLGTGSPAEAVAEALAVHAALGRSLHSFQIGNEVEALRPGYAAYHADYLGYQAAIRVVLPDAPFSGPDSVGNWLYVTNFAATESRDIKLLTTHYYRGDAHNADATLERLLQRDAGWDRRLQQLQQLSRDHGVTYRINEINSYSSGGKRGVSDTFGSALWCLDYMYILAAHGCAGINVETDLNQLGFISHYSPIVHDAAGRCHVRPDYYGMLAFALAGQGDLLKLTLEKGDLNLSAYVTKDRHGQLWLTVVNKDAAQDARVEAALPPGFAHAAAFRLQAPSLTSLDQTTLAGTAVAANGKWHPGPPEPVPVNRGLLTVSVPHASAVLVRLK